MHFSLTFPSPFVRNKIFILKSYTSSSILLFASPCSVNIERVCINNANTVTNFKWGNFSPKLAPRAIGLEEESRHCGRVMLPEHSFATSVESCPVQHPTMAHPPRMYSRYSRIYVDIRWNEESAIVEFERRVVVEGMFEEYQCEDTGEGAWN